MRAPSSAPSATGDRQESLAIVRPRFFHQTLKTTWAAVIVSVMFDVMVTHFDQRPHICAKKSPRFAVGG